MKPLLVGELNPYGSAPEFALYPLPEHASGGRLARILGLSRGEYLRRFDRVNLCLGSWYMRQARVAAAIINNDRPGQPVVLLGARVTAAFGLMYEPFEQHLRFYILPHPSGRNRIWNESGSQERARELLKPFLR